MGEKAGNFLQKTIGSQLDAASSAVRRASVLTERNSTTQEVISVRLRHRRLVNIQVILKLYPNSRNESRQRPLEVFQRDARPVLADRVAHIYCGQDMGEEKPGCCVGQVTTGTLAVLPVSADCDLVQRAYSPKPETEDILPRVLVNHVRVHGTAVSCTGFAEESVGVERVWFGVLFRVV